jgi:hypothetical protein
MPDRDHGGNRIAPNGPGHSDHEGIAEEAKALAWAHYQVEPGLRAVYRLEGLDPRDLRIKLQEVNEQTVPTGIVPVGFAAHPHSGLHYPSVVIEVTPQEYEAIEQERLRLPDGWKVRDPYERPAGSP